MEKLKTNFKKIATVDTFLQMFRYGIITVSSYVFIVAVIFLLKKYIGLDEKISYAIALSIAYVGVYIGYNKFVFKTKHNAGMLHRFLIVLVLSWISNNILFTFWTTILFLSYPIATALNTFVLGIGRFFAQKYYVRKS
jgi:putative flippase GtrA